MKKLIAPAGADDAVRLRLLAATARITAQTTAMAPTMAPTTLLMSGATPTRIPSVMTSARAWTMQAMPSETWWMMLATPSAMARDAVTGDNNNAAKQPNTANGTNAPVENP